jgi:quercetin dioxygenase-like cupin family protein
MMSEPGQEANPIGTALVFEDDRVRIWRIELEPGEEAPFHTHHLDYTSIIVEGDVVERCNADGTRERLEVQPGGITRWYQSTQRHGLKNVGTRRFRNVIVEVKKLPADFADLSTAG